MTWPVAPEGAGGPTRFLISAAMVMNACSTLVAFFADVSRKGMPSWSAYSCKTRDRENLSKGLFVITLRSFRTWVSFERVLNY